jgi:hypothetical protein
MANSDAVAQLYPSNFGNFAVANAVTVSVGATGNAVVALPILGGGLTVGSTAASSGGVIIRKITVQNPNSNLATANIAILTSNDGNASNAVVSNVVLANLTAAGTYQDLTIASPYSTTTVLTGNVSQALYVKVNTAVASGTLDIRVYGDVVTF